VDDPKDEARLKTQKRYFVEKPKPVAPGDTKARSVGKRAQKNRLQPGELGEVDRLDLLNDDELDRLPTRERHGGRRSDGVARRVEKLRAESGVATERSDSELVPGEALVVAITRGQCEVELAGESLVCHLPKALGLAQKSELAVGDRIRIARRPAGDLVAAQVLERTNRLSRPDPFLAHRERVLAANIDLALVVVALKRPPLSVGLIDRFLVALAHGGVPAAIVVNKIDLADDDRAGDAELEALAPYAELGAPLLFCSVKSGEGIVGLRELIAGRTVVFVGHSGVGKSSLLQAVAPEFEVRVNELSSLNDKGRHTTTRARVYRLDDGRSRIVDTPGIREFGLWKLSARELAAYFEEFEPFAPDCHFADCSHTHEPGCAVVAAVEAERLPASRYDAYLRILDSLEQT
jgi:ribosome biogenesis GTPase / thiamine phosphate phosphatase